MTDRVADAYFLEYPVGMLACGLDVKIAFDLPLTILSAVVAVGFTFAATFTSDLSLFLPQRKRRRDDPEALPSPAFIRYDSDTSREDDNATGPRVDERDVLLPPDAGDAGVSWDVLEERVSEGGSLPGDMKSSIWTSWYKRGRTHIIKLVVRAAIWATGIVFMHYCGPCLCFQASIPSNVYVLLRYVGDGHS